MATDELDDRDAPSGDLDLTRLYEARAFPKKADEVLDGMLETLERWSQQMPPLPPEEDVWQ